MSKKLERDIERWVASRCHPSKTLYSDMLRKKGDQIHFKDVEMGSEKKWGAKRMRIIEEVLRIVFDNQKPCASIKQRDKKFTLEVGLPFGAFDSDETRYELPLRDLLMETISCFVQGVNIGGPSSYSRPNGANDLAAFLRHYADIAEHATKLAQAGHDSVMVHNSDYDQRDREQLEKTWVERDTGYSVRLPLPKEIDHG